MTRICYISPLSIHSYRWIEAFAHKGYDVSLIADFSFWVAPRVWSIPVYTSPLLNRTNLVRRLVPNTAEMVAMLKHIDPDFVHLHVQHHYMPAVVLSGFRFVLSSWGLEVLRLPSTNALEKYLAKMTAIKASRVVVDAECLREIWVRLGISKSKIDVIPFGVDTNLFTPDAREGSVREKLEIAKEDIVVISTRPFYNDHYNVECLVKAIPEIVRNFEDVIFILKGKGPLEEYLKVLAEKLGVMSHVRFVGMVPYGEMAKFLSAADIYVSTSFVDSTSVSLLEAMSCGLAPVVTGIPGNKEWVEDGVNGFLYSPKNSEMLAKKVSELVEKRELREAFGKKCVGVVKERASWECCVSKMEAIYEMMVKR